MVARKEKLKRLCVNDSIFNLGQAIRFDCMSNLTDDLFHVEGVLYDIRKKKLYLQDVIVTHNGSRVERKTLKIKFEHIDEDSVSALYD